MSAGPPGYYGKVPARGDFLRRRLPAGMADAWDRWLVTLATAVRNGAGDAWPEVWLTAPLWHFVLGAGLAPPDGAAGVLVASVDRVGRMFPFTIVAPCPGLPPDDWTDSVEALALGALEDGFDPDALDAALAAPPPPRAGEAVGPGESVWWCRGSDRVAPGRHVFTGLPDRAACAAMVLGELP